jgi:gas vesicle protein
MSQQDNFSGGFLLGAVLGGVVGGVLGSILANRVELEAEEADSSPETKPKTPAKRSLRVAPSETFEVTAESARRSLEDKIAQLNDAIDDVRDQLKRVDNGPEAVRSSLDQPNSSDS